MAKKTEDQGVLIDGAPPAPEGKTTAWNEMQSYQRENGYVDPFDAAANPNALPDDFRIEVDTTGVDTIVTLPVGTYHGRCTGIQRGTPSKNGDPCWIWEFQVLEGDHKGETTRHWTYTGPKTLWKFAEVKRALGFQDDEAITPAAIRNRAVTWTMEESVYQGKTRVQVGMVVVPAHHPIGDVVELEEDQVPF